MNIVVCVKMSAVWWCKLKAIERTQASQYFPSGFCNVTRLEKIYSLCIMSKVTILSIIPKRFLTLWFIFRWTIRLKTISNHGKIEIPFGCHRTDFTLHWSRVNLFYFFHWIKLKSSSFLFKTHCSLLCSPHDTYVRTRHRCQLAVFLSSFWFWNIYEVGLLSLFSTTCRILLFQYGN